MYYGTNPYLTQALNSVAEAIDNSANLYRAATDKVTQMAKDINSQNVAYLKETGEKAQGLLAPFQALGATAGQQLLNILGGNGSEAQLQSIQSMIQAGNMDQQNLQTLSSLYGNDPNTNPFMHVMNQLTGMQDAGSAAANILNADALQYGKDITQSGISQAEDAANAYRNNSLVQQSMQSMNDLANRSITNSAAAKGMANSGRMMADLYNQGQATAGQYLLPQMSNVYNQVMSSNSAAANQMLGVQGSLANQIVGSGTQLAGALANSMIGSNTTMAGNVLQNSTSGLANMFNTGQNAAANSANVLGNLGAAISGQNTQMGQTISNALMSQAQNQGQANLAGAQLQVQMAQQMSPQGMW